MILKHVAVCLCFIVAVAVAVAVACGGGGSSTPTAPTPTPTPTPTPAPDLVVVSPTVNDSSPAVGATFTLSTTVRNDGAGDAPATTLRAYRSTDGTITTSDASDAVAAVGELAAGATITVIPATYSSTTIRGWICRRAGGVTPTTTMTSHARTQPGRRSGVAVTYEARQAISSYMKTGASGWLRHLIIVSQGRVRFPVTSST